MRAVGVHRFGGPEQLTVMDLPVPEPGQGEVRVRVHAAAVNPTDTTFIAGRRAEALKARGINPPYIPGMDISGDVDAVGPCTERFRRGDAVMGITLPVSSRGGGYAEYVLVPESSLVKVPSAIDYPLASTIPMNGLTALAVLEELDLRPEQSLAITGAAGTLGGYTVQLAATRGLRVLADAKESDAQTVRDLGAAVVVARGRHLAQRFLEHEPGGVDAVLDAALLRNEILPALRPGGRLAVVRDWDEAPTKGIEVRQIRVPEYAHRTDLLEQLRVYTMAGQLSPRVADVYPAERAADTHRRLAAGGVRGRLVLRLTSEHRTGAHP